MQTKKRLEMLERAATMAAMGDAGTDLDKILGKPLAGLTEQEQAVFSQAWGIDYDVILEVEQAANGDCIASAPPKKPTAAEFAATCAEVDNIIATIVADML